MRHPVLLNFFQIVHDNQFSLVILLEKFDVGFKNETTSRKTAVIVTFATVIEILYKKDSVSDL